MMMMMTFILNQLDQQITLTVLTKVADSYQSFLRKFISLYSTSSSLLVTPIEKTAIYGVIDAEFIDFMGPGMMLTIIFTLSIGLTAIIFVKEKKGGQIERTSVAGVNTFELIISHLTLKLVIMLTQTIVLLLIGIVIFKIDMKGSIFIAGILLILQGICGMSCGILFY
jgi:hypothetical protein